MYCTHAAPRDVQFAQKEPYLTSTSGNQLPEYPNGSQKRINNFSGLVLNPLQRSNFLSFHGGPVISHRGQEYRPNQGATECLGTSSMPARSACQRGALGNKEQSWEKHTQRPRGRSGRFKTLLFRSQLRPRPPVSACKQSTTQTPKTWAKPWCKHPSRNGPHRSQAKRLRSVEGPGCVQTTCFGFASERRPGVNV